MNWQFGCVAIAWLVYMLAAVKYAPDFEPQECLLVWFAFFLLFVAMFPF